MRCRQGVAARMGVGMGARSGWVCHKYGGGDRWVCGDGPVSQRGKRLVDGWEKEGQVKEHSCGGSNRPRGHLCEGQ